MTSKALIGLAIILAISFTAFAVNNPNSITGAFSNNVQTQGGNNLASGWFDLDVGLLFSSHNDEICRITLMSGTEDIVKGTGKHAVETYDDNPVWTASITGAKWIWKSYYVENPGKNEEYTFVREFYTEWLAEYAILEIASDNTYEIKLNGFSVGKSSSQTNYDKTHTHDLRRYVFPGRNVLEIKVKNIGGNNDPKLNPAGLLYRLEVKKALCSFFKKDISGKAIYNLEDVKPGDHGLDTLSLNAKGNDAWVCVLINNKEDNENTLTEPEANAGDTTEDPNGGELSQNLELFGWLETFPDNKYGFGDTFLFKGSLKDAVSSFAIADSENNRFLKKGMSERIGIFWCLGQITVNKYIVKCDGSTADDKAQTDSMTADVVFYAEQHKNNPGFKCSSLV